MKTPAKTPECIGFVMDGNRRWAKEKGLATLKGHQIGLNETFQNILKLTHEKGVKNAIVYAFSTENWKRSKDEVEYLMKLFSNVFSDIKIIHEKKIRVYFLGQKDRASQKIQNLMNKLEEDTRDYTNGKLGIAFSYGGRTEILQAAQFAIDSGIKKLTEENFSQLLWTKEFPDPDIIVRTGDAMRLSNFLPWQSVYSELYFTKTLWPDFNEEELDLVLQEYDKRERRLGK